MPLEYKVIRARPGADAEAQLNREASHGWRLDKLTVEGGVWWLVLVRPRLRYAQGR